MREESISVEIKTPILQENRYDYIDVSRYAYNNGFLYTCSSIIIPMMNGNKISDEIIVDSSFLNKSIVNIDELMNVKELSFNADSVLCLSLCYSLFIDSL